MTIIKKKKLFVLALMVFIVLTMFSGCGEKQSLPVGSTVKVIFSGSDGYGKAIIENSHDWTNKMKAKEDMEDKNVVNKYKTIEGAIKYSLSENNNLSNGDVVTLTITADNEILSRYGYEVQDQTKTFTVNGLKNHMKYDAFSYLTVTTTGIAPYADLSMKVSSNIINGLKFSADKTENLNNGDVVTITVETQNGEDVESYCTKKGYALTRTSMKYTVSGVTNYVWSMNEIPDEWLRKMKSKTEEIIDVKFEESRAKSDVEGEEFSEVKELIKKEYVGYYLFTLKDGIKMYDNGYHNNANEIVMLYKITATGSDGYMDYYYTVTFRNAQMIKNETFSVDLLDYSTTTSEFVKGYYYDTTFAPVDETIPEETTPEETNSEEVNTDEELTGDEEEDTEEELETGEELEISEETIAEENVDATNPAIDEEIEDTEPTVSEEMYTDGELESEEEVIVDEKLDHQQQQSYIGLKSLSDVYRKVVMPRLAKYNFETTVQH